MWCQSGDAPEGHMTASVPGPWCEHEVCPGRDAVRVDFGASLSPEGLLPYSHLQTPPIVLFALRDQLLWAVIPFKM